MIHNSEAYIKAVNKTTWISMILNVLLSVLKVFFGGLYGSIALVSDGIHSLTDIFTDIVVWAGAKLGQRPPDGDHHFGHGKYETFAELILAMFILVPAVTIIWYAFRSIYFDEEKAFHWMITVAAAISLITKEGLFRWVQKIGSNFNSQMLFANAWHHRTDAFSSLVVLIGSGFSFLGIYYADAIAGIVVGFLIGAAGLKVLHRGIMDLTESTPGKEMEKRVHTLLKETSGVKSFHKVRIRRLGSHLMMDMHIMVDPSLNIKTAHDISTEVEYKIKKNMGFDTTNVLVHIEPYMDDHQDL